MKSWSMTIQVKATGLFFSVVLFLLLTMVLTSESVGEIQRCDPPSNKSYWVVLFCGVVYFAVQEVFNFEYVDEILKCDHLNESHWAVLCFFQRFCTAAMLHGRNYENALH